MGWLPTSNFYFLVLLQKSNFNIHHSYFKKALWGCLQAAAQTWLKRKD